MTNWTSSRPALEYQARDRASRNVAQIISSLSSHDRHDPIHSIYQVDYTPKAGADRWLDRRIRQNLSSIAKSVGPSHADNDAFYRNVEMMAYQDSRDSVFNLTGLREADEI
ncbi:unnamed protein product [Protopolystoma xenopodis]|uniref:Uncharacterized protein n=1 Tax=Protopolystoma xenopodis TaxID=117903 RepID=A0A3S5BEB8_9PLAT|nr:unnamed protein product [Protopolystoma xenopodis]